jgi:glycine dehydrogenase
LPISWAYIRLLGGAGLTKATQIAILSANYIASRLQSSYPILYTGQNERVAHECILDIREITKVSGIGVDDIAKRLMDYGFHAPTMSFPVAGTLMIEPTESEDIREIERFIDAMISIRAEIEAIIKGEISVDDSPLRHAPHTSISVSSTQWSRAYTCEIGGYPKALEGYLEGEIIGSRMKYWPPVSRIDGAHGDRNLICACTPVSDYAE